MRQATCAFLFTALLASCAMVNPTVKASKTVSMADLGAVAVLQFDGYNGDQFSDAIAQELLMRGVEVVERSRLLSILTEQGLSASDITSGRINYQKVGGILGVDTIILGSVSPIIVYASGAPSGKVSTASLRLVRVKTGVIIAAATFDANTELLAGSVLYPEAAETLVNSIMKP